MKMKGENTSAWLENFKTRRPLSMASTKKARKPKTKAVPKPLTAVKEENENEMQGYSENFESEN
jgi:regulator of replication initiation timing